METVTHRGRTTAYRRTGVKENTEGGQTADGPVLYVHGSGATHRLWVHQYGADRPAPTVALDLSGHGNSGDVDVSGPAALSAYADDVVAVARETGARILAGNSLGGAVVLQVALERSVGLDALILADTGARLPVHPDLLEWLEGDFERAIDFLHRPDFLFHDPDPEWVQRTTAALRETGAAVTARDFQVCNAFDVRERLDEVDVPALVVHGEHDHLTPPEWNEYLATHVPGAELVEIRDAAHLPMVERPGAFNRAVETFLDRV